MLCFCFISPVSISKKSLAGHIVFCSDRSQQMNVIFEMSTRMQLIVLELF